MHATAGTATLPSHERHRVFEPQLNHFDNATALCCHLSSRMPRVAMRNPTRRLSRLFGSPSSYLASLMAVFCLGHATTLRLAALTPSRTLYTAPRLLNRPNMLFAMVGGLDGTPRLMPLQSPFYPLRVSIQQFPRCNHFCLVVAFPPYLTG